MLLFLMLKSLSVYNNHFTIRQFLDRQPEPRQALGGTLDVLRGRTIVNATFAAAESGENQSSMRNRLIAGNGQYSIQRHIQLNVKGGDKPHYCKINLFMNEARGRGCCGF